MEKNLTEWINTHVIQDTLYSVDEIPLNTYHILHEHSKGAILMIHGFCEFFGKYHEVFYRFYQEGYSVFFLELRGHGKSGNVNEYEDRRVSVGSFEEYVQDVSVMYEYMSSICKDEKKMLFAHSMGGGISTLYMEKYPDDFACAVLSSPMIAINYGTIPTQIIDLAGVYANVKRLDDDYAPGQSGWTGKYGYNESSSTDEERYAYQFNLRLKDSAYQTWGATWRWAKAARAACIKMMKNAGKLKTPILLFQAEYDSMVQNAAQNLLKKKTRCVTIVKVKNSKHEIFSTPDVIFEKYLKDIFDFYAIHAR